MPFNCRIINGRVLPRIRRYLGISWMSARIMQRRCSLAAVSIVALAQPRSFIYLIVTLHADLGDSALVSLIER